MTPEEAMQLLTRITAVEGRSFTGQQAVIWSELLTLDGGEPINLHDAVLATMDYHRSATYPIKPADIIARVKTIRRTRIADDPAPLPPVDPSDTAAYIGWVKAWARARGDGADPDIAEQIADHECGVTRPREIEQQRQIPLPQIARP